MKTISALTAVLICSTALSLAGCKDEPPADQKPAQAPSAGTAADTVSSGLPECDAYMASYAKFMSCDKVPVEAKDGFRKQFDGTKQSWSTLKDPSVPTQIKQQYAEICKQGEATLKQTAAPLGCAF